MDSARWSWLGALCLVACAFESASSPAAIPNPAGTETDSTSGAATTTQDATGETAALTSSATDPFGTGGSESSTTDDTEDAGAEPGCPSLLPAGWVLCEDFEDVDDLATHFSGLTGVGLAIGGPGYESSEALEITHFAQQNWVGELRLRFGQGPDASNVVQPASQFEELWVRLRFRAGEGWPVEGPGDMLSVDGVDDGSGWAATFKARISAGQDEPSLRTGAFTCVFESDHPCTGVDDWDLLSYLGGDLGQVDVFGESVAQQWHCAVIHARLNAPGASDGLVEVLVDDQPDASTANLNLRGSRADLGFNLLSISTYMEVPLQEDRRRYIDDVVVSTQFLECQ